MEVKVGDQVYDSEAQPIMVILTDQDKKNIANMDPDCTKYAMFQDDWGSKQEMLDWMETD
ncbi:hypothetical protein LCGC14_2279000 [marine sediment metagenome]|uniref:Uncharacterized protein n=1 Tax=marine sediment metagenome TaxID=412755 RepID=A0A0F9F744_9ZZZZ